MALTQVSASGIKDGSISSSDLADGSITTAKIADDAITADKLNNTGVTAGSYTLSSVTVDAQGRVTAASSGTPVDADKIIEGNTEVEAVDTGSDGHIKATTEGSERFRVGPAGQMGIGGANYGTSGQVLMSGGASAAPTWGDVSSSPTFEATASGTLANGDTVIINANGTVSAVTESAVTAAAATPVTFESASTNHIASVFGNGKVLVCYADAGNSNYGTAVFGSVSGTTITFGTPVVFRSSYIQWTAVSYDSTHDKFLVSYRDINNSSNLFSTVIYRSGTDTVNTGSTVQVRGANVLYLAQAYCADEDTHVVAYQNQSSNNGQHQTLTLNSSNNNISVGTDRTFDSSSGVRDVDIAIQGKNSIIIWKRYTGNEQGYYRVGQVDSTNNNGLYYPGSIGQWATHVTAKGKIVFVGTNKVAIAWDDEGTNPTGSRGAAIIGTVSNTLEQNDGSITFGNQTAFTTNGHVSDMGLVYDSNADRIVIAYEDSDDSDKGKFVTGTISGTSVSFSSPTVFETGNIYGVKWPTFDTNANKVVVPYVDQDDNSYGKVAVLTTPYTATNLTTTNYIGISDGAYANGATATVQVVGSVDDAQSSLTPGSEYYVQRNGSLATTAASPSVKAGLAVGTTKLLIK